LNDYFASNGMSPGAGSSQKVEDEPVDSEPHRIRVLSWNVDGLDNNSIELRTKAVCRTIEK